MADITYTRRFGDRREGRRLRSLSPIQSFEPYIMPERSDASNWMADTFDTAAADVFLRQAREAGYKGMGLLHLIIAAYVRTVAACPGLNRFVAGRRIYARKDIQVVMSVKREMTAEAPDASIKVWLEPTDTVYDVYRKLNAEIDAVKADDTGNDVDAIAETLVRLPRFLLRGIIGLLRALDYFDLLPMALLNASPFHGSMIITDLGSLGAPAINHHIYNFGNLPLFISFGTRRRAVEVDRAGRLVERRYVDVRVTMDERICDGYYYATALKYIKYYFRNPQLLEQPPEKVREDIR